MQLKICVVEDNIIVADLLCSMLLKYGYAVTEPALSYHMALQIIESEKPDVLARVMMGACWIGSASRKRSAP